MPGWMKPLLFMIGLVAAIGFFLYFMTEAGPVAIKTELSAGSETPKPVKLVARDQFVDERACAKCHPGEAAAHQGSGHSSTLRLAESIEGLAAYFDKPFADPGYPGVEWRLGLSPSKVGARNQLMMTRERAATESSEKTVERDWLQFGFGSGHHGLTFVTLIDDMKDGRPRGREHRVSFFKQADGWGVTPGQERWKNIPGEIQHGREVFADEMRKCFGCHSTFLSDRGSNRVDFDQYIPNVGCQSCHGPAASHVAEARKAAPSPEALQMPFGHERASAQQELDACGRCHRLPSEFMPDQLTPDNVLMVRFQPVGIMKSRCRQESGEPLRCVNCHDPHFRADPDRSSYERVCNSCHSDGKSPCRVSNPPPASGCVDCHMPKVPASPPATFTNHWIRAVRPSPSVKAN